VKPKTMLLAVVAVVCGLAAMWMTNRLLADRQKEVPVVEAKEKVLVAKAKIPSQTLFKEPEKYFEEREVVVSAIPRSALRSVEKLKDKRLSRTLAEGGYVVPEDLVNPETDGLGAVLPAGMRAVTIRVQPDSLVGGWVIPKSHVDVLCTVRNNEGSSTYTILENMEVLAIDLKSNRSPDDPPAIMGTTVTLTATPEDCNLIKMAAGNGELNLVLRGIGDDRPTKPKASTQKALQNPRQLFRDASSEGDNTVVASGGQRIPDLPPIDQSQPLPVLPPGQGPAPLPGQTPPSGQQPPLGYVPLEGGDPTRKDPELEVFIMTIMNGTNIEKIRFVRKPGDPWTAVKGDPTNPASPPSDKTPEIKPNTAVPPVGAGNGIHS
jgi:Flp pilus assembly protein CpaB